MVKTVNKKNSAVEEESEKMEKTITRDEVSKILDAVPRYIE